MTTLQTAIVSRKTPRDGKLEITPATADRIATDGAFTVVLGDAEAPGAVVSMPCGCKEGSHTIHVFVQSDILQSLAPETRVTLDLDVGAPKRLHIVPVPA